MSKSGGCISSRAQETSSCADVRATTETQPASAESGAAGHEDKERKGKAGKSGRKGANSGKGDGLWRSRGGGAYGKGGAARGNKKARNESYGDVTTVSGVAAGPVTLGTPPDPVLPNLQRASKGGQVLSCMICCTAGPTYVAVGSCGHVEICWVCALRQRLLDRNFRCPICKTDLVEILLIGGDVSLSLDQDAWQSLPVDEEMGVRFANDRVRGAAVQLIEYRCTLGECNKQLHQSFATLADLERHMWRTHWVQFCEVCLYERSAFLCEQRVYSSKELSTHRRYGDYAQPSGPHPVPAVPPHPSCEFCQRRFYSEDDLVKHMYRKHHLCHICERAGRRNHFYANWLCLGLHYQENHHVCAHKDCMRGSHRLVAFADDDELQVHYQSEHADCFKGSDRGNEKKNGMKLQVGLASYAAGSKRNSNQQHQRNRTATNMSHTVDSSDGAGIVSTIQFSWPAIATSKDTRAELLKQSASQDETWAGQPEDDSGGEGGTTQRTMWRYPRRDPPVECLQSRDTADDIPCPDNNNEDQDAPLTARVEDKEMVRDSEECLDRRIEALDLEMCTIATDGPRRGQRSCLDAIHAMLRALYDGDAEKETHETDAQLRDAIDGLTAMEAENLERLRSHLAPQEVESRQNKTLDEQSDSNWEPLEKLLALRPRFFLLVRSLGNDGIGSDIGARRKLWCSWKLAAQKAILMLRDRERLCVLRYVALCRQRRAQLRTIDIASGSVFAGTDESATLAEEFPCLVLGDAAADSSYGSPANARTWGPASRSRISSGQRSVNDDVSSAAVATECAAGYVVEPEIKQEEIPAKIFEGITAEAFPSLAGSGPTKAVPPRWIACSPKMQVSVVASPVEPCTVSDDATAVAREAEEDVVIEKQSNELPVPAQPLVFDLDESASQFPSLSGTSRQPKCQTSSRSVKKSQTDTDQGSAPLSMADSMSVSIDAGQLEKCDIADNAGKTDVRDECEAKTAPPDDHDASGLKLADQYTEAVVRSQASTVSSDTNAVLLAADIAQMPRESIGEICQAPSSGRQAKKKKGRDKQILIAFG